MAYISSSPIAPVNTVHTTPSQSVMYGIYYLKGIVLGIILVRFCLIFWSDGNLLGTTKIVVQAPEIRSGAMLTVDSINSQRKSLLPPLVLLSSPCSGSSFVIEFAQKLVKRHLGIEAYRAEWLEKEEEYLATAKKKARNPNYNYTLANMEPQQAGIEMVHATFETISRNNISRAMIVKLLPKHNVPGVVAGLQELNTRFVHVYRRNLLEKTICGIKDCFHDWQGHVSVFENGTRSHLCFGRRKYPHLRVLGQFNISNYSVQMETLMDQWGCEKSLTDPEVIVRVRDGAKPYEIRHFPQLALESLEAFEYAKENTLEFDKSLADWKIFLRAWEIEPQEDLILEEMRVYGINVRKHKSPLNNVYNKHEVEGLFTKWARKDNGFCDWRWMLKD